MDARQSALTALQIEKTADALWQALEAFQGEPFRTAKGLDFVYTLRGGELFVSRKEKSITRATVELAYKRTLTLGADATGPKKLGVFGASYLYPIFLRLGIIPLPDKETCEKLQFPL